ncbi:MAG: PGN_0703 family putative restriction endonuclease [Syntrophorhabdaceae bacterium]
MKAYDHILTKQIQWALNRGISLVGSKGENGRPAYTPELSQNLFEPLEPLIKECFIKGDGNEIGNPNNPGKMQAVHSSSALGVNVFQYWQKINQLPTIATACGFCRKGNNNCSGIIFEDKYAINGQFSFSPNVDVVFHNSESSRYQRFAIECKFSEAYGSRRHGGLKTAYLDLETLWGDIPNIRNLAKSISPDDNRFIHLHAAQLIKHVLGLKAQCGLTGFKLLYLWYDVYGAEGSRHRSEIEAFSNVVNSDGVRFNSMTYQELIAKLSAECRNEHEPYVRYLTERYL